MLHNFLRETAGKDYMPNMAVDTENEDGQIVPGVWRQEEGLDSLTRNRQKNAGTYAKDIRNSLSMYFVTKEGELPWQYSRVDQF